MLFGSHFCVQQQAGHSHNSIHGCADLVTHVGQEFALSLIGLFGQFLRFLGSLFGSF